MLNHRLNVGPAQAAVMLSSLLLISSLAIPVSAQESTPSPVPLDVTGNGVVNDSDASPLITAWIGAQEQNECMASSVGAYDFSGNGCLDVADIQTVMSAWGEPADPNTPPSDEAGVSAMANVPIIVNSLGDEPDASTTNPACATVSGQCTLRAAIQQSNVNPGHDTITFGLGACDQAAPLTINVASTATTMLVLDDAGKAGTTIDGYTQCNAKPNNLQVGGDAVIRVEVKGRAFDPSLTFEQKFGVYGLNVASPNNVIRGLSLWGWDVNLYIAGSSASNNRIEGNFIGSNATLTQANVNDPNFSSTFPSRGGGDGLRLQNFANNNWIGGATPAQRNIISGGWDGLSMEYRTQNTRVYNNYIGLKQDGVTMWRNGADGVDINFGSQGNIIGGTGPGERNIISGNGSDGVEVSHSSTEDGATTSNNKIIGNYIGPSATGGKTSRPSWAIAGNLSTGVTLEDNVTTVEIAHNVISDNGHNGVRLHSRISNSSIHHNLIGVAPNGISAMPNGLSTSADKFRKGHNGVGIYGDSNHNVVSENVIAYNKGYGVWISNGYTEYKEFENKQTDYNTVSRNQIFGNGDWEYLVEPVGSDVYEGVQKGIRLKSQDGDVPNLGIAPPTIEEAYTNVVKGKTCARCTVEVFIADTTSANNANGENYGQGKTFIGTAVADSTGSFAAPVTGVSGGQIVTATTTDRGNSSSTPPVGNTSQFARNVQVRAGTEPNPNPAPTPTPRPNPLIQNPVWLPLVFK